MSTLMDRRRAMMMSAGASIDWESIARGMTDFTTPFSVPAELVTADIRDGAYGRRANLQAIDLGNSLTAIGGGAFQYCTGLTEIIIPDSVTNIGSSAFQGCTGLTSIDIPNSVTTINGTAFRDCSYLRIVNIGTGITTIGERAFYSDTRLTYIKVLATAPPTISQYSFGNTMNCPIYVPDASLNAYKTTGNWATYYVNRIFPISDLNV